MKTTTYKITKDGKTIGFVHFCQDAETAIRVFSQRFGIDNITANPITYA